MNSNLLAAVRHAAAPVQKGTVISSHGLHAIVGGLETSVGDVLDVNGTDAEVIAVSRSESTVMPLASGWTPSAGAPVTHIRRGGVIPVGLGLVGRVVDALGRPIDGKGPLSGVQMVSENHAVPNALDRTPVVDQIGTGVRAVDTFTALGRGQRIGLFAGSGVGKSSLLSMVARGTDAEISVIALVGERGREVRGFLEDDLGPEGLARSVVVVATGDEPAMMRRKAAFTATRIAEFFRDQGTHAVLMMDSLTRVAMAQREIGLSAGEPPASRGYPPSTFSLLPALLERAGTDKQGSVTGIYTVLVDGDDHNDPISDAARSILDGHLVLDRRLAVAGHFPSIDVLASISRCASAVMSTTDRSAITTVRRAMADKKDVQDLVEVGAYSQGTRPLADLAMAAQADIDRFLRQDMDDSTPLEQAWERLRNLSTLLGWTNG